MTKCLLSAHTVNVVNAKCATFWSSKLMFRLCILAMLMLHEALLKVLHIFFDNFQSNFRGQEATSELQTCDVEENAEIFQFQIAALYQLQVAWLNKCVCMYSYRQTYTRFVCTDTETCEANYLHPDENTGLYCFVFPFYFQLWELLYFLWVDIRNNKDLRHWHFWKYQHCFVFRK